MFPAPNDQATSAPAAEKGPTLDEWFRQYRERLRLLVTLRIDRRVLGRLDASDVVQETFLEATERYDKFVAAPSMTPRTCGFGFWQCSGC
jgi:RNA polymerase sigma-70 factor (ECF subfamily)